MSRSRLRLLAPLVALLLVFAACSGDDDDDGGSSAAGGDASGVEDDDDEGEVEETTTTLAPEDALAGAGEAAIDLPERVEAWQAGDLDDDEMRREARAALVAAGDAREAVARLDDGEESKPLSVGAAELYFQHAVTVLEAVNAQDGPARDEFVVLALDLGELAARTLEWALHVQDPDGAEPPRPLPGDTEAPLDRPTQPESAWIAALDALGAPSTIDENADPAEQAEVFRSAAATMGAEADPDTEDGHLVAARLRLDWLVKAAAADAARVGLPSVASPLTMVHLAIPVVSGEDDAA